MARKSKSSNPPQGLDIRRDRRVSKGEKCSRCAKLAIERIWNGHRSSTICSTPSCVQKESTWVSNQPYETTMGRSLVAQGSPGTGPATKAMNLRTVGEAELRRRVGG